MSANQQPDFFSDVESLSPKLLWLKKHGLETAFDQGWASEGSIDPWSCYKPDNATPRDWHVFLGDSGFGDTEDAAICAYCAKHGLTHYTLEDRQ